MLGFPRVIGRHLSLSTMPLHNPPEYDAYSIIYDQFMTKSYLSFILVVWMNPCLIQRAAVVANPLVRACVLVKTLSLSHLFSDPGHLDRVLLKHV